jgi:hypothetical protein
VALVVPPESGVPSAWAVQLMEVGVRELRNHVYQILLNRAPASRRCTLHCRTGERRPAAHTGDYLAAYETVVGGRSTRPVTG